MELEQRDNDHEEEKDHSLGLADALPLGSRAGVERIINVVRQHHGLLGRFASRQR